jgi:hypothetical protein
MHVADTPGGTVPSRPLSKLGSYHALHCISFLAPRRATTVLQGTGRYLVTQAGMLVAVH